MTEAQRAYYRKWYRKKYQADSGPILKKNAAYTMRNHARRLAYWKDYNTRLRKRAPRVKVSEMPPEQAEAFRKYKREYQQRNAIKLRAYWKDYREKHSVKTKAHNKSNWHKRRALLAAATVNLRGIKAYMRRVLSKPSFKCYYCEERFPISDCHFDHIVPVSKGGMHAVENLCTACAECNQAKHAKTIDAWVRVGQQVLSL